MLKNMDKRQLEEGIKKAKDFLSTPEGKSAAEKIKKGQLPEGVPDDLKKAAETLSKNPESAKKLSSLLGL